MILFFGKPKNPITALQIETKLEDVAIEKIVWLLDAPWLDKESISGTFIGPRATMITPWSTNAV
jgi:phosphoribosylformylglycinamidine synthase